MVASEGAEERNVPLPVRTRVVVDPVSTGRTQPAAPLQVVGRKTPQRPLLEPPLRDGVPRVVPYYRLWGQTVRDATRDTSEIGTLGPL